MVESSASWKNKDGFARDSSGDLPLGNLLGENDLTRSKTKTVLKLNSAGVEVISAWAVLIITISQNARSAVFWFDCIFHVSSAEELGLMTKYNLNVNTLYITSIGVLNTHLYTWEEWDTPQKHYVRTPARYHTYLPNFLCIMLKQQ